MSGHRLTEENSSNWKTNLAGAVILAVFFAPVISILVGLIPGYGEVNPNTVTCDDENLINQAKSLVEGNHNLLYGKIAILQSSNFRDNDYYGVRAATAEDIASMPPDNIVSAMLADRKHQCAADIMTNHGEMTLYYGWKVIDATTYIEALPVPVVN